MPPTKESLLSGLPTCTFGINSPMSLRLTYSDLGTYLKFHFPYL